jgi:DNA-directed RNA polymerase specialized sigma24 family protein
VAVEGRSYEETLALLQIPAGTLKSRLNRARRQLRAALADHLDPVAA